MLPTRRTWTLQEIRAGRPLITSATQDQFVPQMVNFEQIGGVDFQKGCYPGQEIVARAQYRGEVKRRMVRVQAPAGAELKPGAGFQRRRGGGQRGGRSSRRDAGLNYYVYYKIDSARLRQFWPLVQQIFPEIEKQTGIRGRWMRRRDDPTTYMEVYEGVKDETAFEAVLEREGAKLGVPCNLRRKVERFIAAETPA